MEGEDGHLDGCDSGFEQQVGSDLVSGFEAVFEHGSHDSAQAKGGFNNAGGVLLLHNVNYFLLELDVILGDDSRAVVNCHFDFALGLEFFFKGSFLLFIQFLEISGDGLRLLFELLTNNLSLKDDGGLLFGSGFFEFS